MNFCQPLFKLSYGEFHIHAHGVNPPKDWEPPKGFPFCCPFHQETVKVSEEYVAKFPLCCNEHKQLAKRLGFKNSQFKYLKTKIINQLSYTEFLIENNIKNLDWYEDITDYIEFNLHSFGSPPIGQHIYFRRIEGQIKRNSFKMPLAKQKKLVSYINQIQSPKKKYQSADLNALVDIYNKWFNSFPFELTFLVNLKNHFSKQLPIVKEILRTNRYSGQTAFVTHTEESMVELLIGLTNQILKLINTKELIQKGHISDIEATRFELVCQERVIKSKKLFEDYTNQEREYLATIKQWLTDEKEFFNDLKTFDKKSIMPPAIRSKLKKGETTSFKPKHGKDEKIKAIIYELNREFYLLNEEKCTPDDLLNVLLAKQIKYEKDIHFNCYTNQLALIITQFKNRKYFDGLSYASVVNTDFFYSKEGSKLKGNIFSSSWNQNPNPERETEIVAIFDKFQ
ncbi:hypothetical protein [Fluviicola taffensis]|uniref:Uncharacterized protein n=1 Tax=Fluviicola taffensis (strain DSM 16823 / NCIMB 13979 / RW262) TaxID=755732 RepID=F2IGJ5_FLUTR|nr:hypothetical protein [Fluviicola taffensis]AEA42601.1 hypothetical protein Fluta_0597 [Fluviicola taffensis DSM 16823]